MRVSHRDNANSNERFFSVYRVIRFATVGAQAWLARTKLKSVLCSRKRKTMSTREDDAGSEENIPEGRIVTDSVHERLRQPSVYCPTCKENIPANNTEIEKHFVASHASNVKCLYCQGKVFKYLSFHIDPDGQQVAKNETYHSCRRSE